MAYVDMTPVILAVAGRPELALAYSFGQIMAVGGVLYFTNPSGRKFMHTTRKMASDIWHIQDVWDAAGEDIKKNPPEKQKSILEIWRESKP